MILSTSPPEAFPELQIGELERYAERWTDLFSSIPITSITLHHVFNKQRANKEETQSEINL